MALERTGDVEGAEQALLAAKSMDTERPLTLMDLARFAADRGDAERGLALRLPGTSDVLHDPVGYAVASYRMSGGIVAAARSRHLGVHV